MYFLPQRWETRLCGAGVPSGVLGLPRDGGAQSVEMGLIYLTRLLLKKALKENKNIILGVAQFWEALLMC